MSVIPSRQRVAELSSEQLRAICALYDRIWPQAGSSLVSRSEELRDSWAQSGREVFALWQGQSPLALAMHFPRTIQGKFGPLPVMALAGVCSAPEQRGLGLGAAVVRAAFALVDQGLYPVALFQTPVPRFYEKLGARLIPNTFTYARHRPGEKGSAEQPWWEPHIMIYPASFSWPEGPFDLGGPGY